MSKEFEFLTTSWSPTFHFLCNNIQINSISLISPDTVEDVIGSRIVIVWRAASWSLISGQNICKYSSQRPARVTTVSMGTRWREQNWNFDESWSCEKITSSNLPIIKNGIGNFIWSGADADSTAGVSHHTRRDIMGIYRSITHRLTRDSQSTPNLWHWQQAAFIATLDKISPGAGGRWAPVYHCLDSLNGQVWVLALIIPRYCLIVQDRAIRRKCAIIQLRDQSNVL